MGGQLDELSVIFSGDPPFMSHHCVIVLLLTNKLMMMTMMMTVTKTESYAVHCLR